MRIGTSVEVRRAEIEEPSGGSAPEASSWAAARYRALALALGAWVIDNVQEHNMPEGGWRRAVANMLQVSLRELVAILHETRGALTLAICTRAIERLQLPGVYFADGSIRELTPEECGAAWAAGRKLRDQQFMEEMAHRIARSERGFRGMPRSGPIELEAALASLGLVLHVVAGIENAAIDNRRYSPRHLYVPDGEEKLGAIAWGMGCVLLDPDRFGPHSCPLIEAGTYGSGSDDALFSELVGRTFLNGPRECMRAIEGVLEEIGGTSEACS